MTIFAAARYNKILMKETREIEFDLWWEHLKLGRPDLEVFDRYYFQGYDISELAEKYGLSKSGIKRRLMRARGYLKGLLGAKSRRFGKKT